MLFCGIFGALGGVVHALDLSSKVTVTTLIKTMIVSFSTGLLLFFTTYDFNWWSPAMRIAASLIAGFYGSALFKKLAQVYMKQALNYIQPQDVVQPNSINKLTTKQQGEDDEYLR